jgi:hypothetical protein
MRIKYIKISAIIVLLAISVFIVLPNQMVKAQTATISVVPQNNPVTVGQTLTINIKISNVQNLYGVDIALTWDTSMLKLVSNQTFVPVSNGVGILNPQVLFVQESADQSTGEYNLVATSENPAGPFSGSATVATLTFTVTSTGSSTLTLKSSTSSTPQLASYAAPGSGETSQPISATVVNGNVYTASSSSSPSSAPTSTASSTPSSSSSSPSEGSSPTATATASSTPKSSSSVPELSGISLAAIVVLVTFGALMLLAKTKKKSWS